MKDVFIDESGIFRVFGHSVYCLTICDSVFSSELDSKIAKVEENLKILPFHWRSHTWKIKEKFLKEILRIEKWECVLVVIGNKNYSYDLFQNLLSKALQGTEIRRMYIDGKKHKDYVNGVKKSFLARLNFDQKAKKESLTYYKKFLKQKITTQIVGGY